MRKTTLGLGELNKMKTVGGKERFYQKHQVYLPTLVHPLVSLLRFYWGNTWLWTDLLSDSMYSQVFLSAFKYPVSLLVPPLNFEFSLVDGLF